MCVVPVLVTTYIVVCFFESAKVGLTKQTKRVLTTENTEKNI